MIQCLRLGLVLHSKLKVRLVAQRSLLSKEKSIPTEFITGDIEMGTDRTTVQVIQQIIRQGDTVFNEGGAIYLGNYYGEADSTDLMFEVGSDQSGISVAIAGTGFGFDIEDYNYDIEDLYLEKGGEIAFDLVMHVDEDVAAGTVINSNNFWAYAEDYQNGDHLQTSMKINRL